MALYIATESELTSVADAIRTKGGTSSPLVFPAGFVSAIEDIPTGGTTVEPKDVNFIDYDGTIVAAYTAEEFAALDALPENPTHEGLTAQGWNWSLSDAKTYVAECGMLWVGQMYITDDEKTRVYISLNGKLSPTVGLAVNGTAEVDWGDESATDTLTGSSTSTVVTVSHTYATAGDYVISISVTGTAKLVGSTYQGSNYYSRLIEDSNYNIGQNYRTRVKKIEIGSNIEIGDAAFANIYMASITIPSSVTSVSNSDTFTNCRNLRSITIPNSSSNTGSFRYCASLKYAALPKSANAAQYAFGDCTTLESISLPAQSVSNLYIFAVCPSLRRVVVPKSTNSLGAYLFQGSGIGEFIIPDLTAIQSYTFSYCVGLRSITIPNSVGSIGGNAFNGCYLNEIHFEPSTPPTVSNSSAFSNALATDGIVYVPYSEDHSVLEAYKAATNYPSSSTYTYMEEPAS